MSVAQSEPRYTVEEYLALESDSEERHEYLDGQIYLMAGESPEHADICTNLVIQLGMRLRDTNCRVRSKDTKVRSGPSPVPRKSAKGLFSYPDVVVICGEPQYYDENRDVVINPTVIIEVLSDSTEAFDRGEKFLRYQNWNASLTDYILVSQFAVIVEHFVRKPDGSWSYQVYQGLDQSLVIESVDCRLQLSEVYDRIVFSTDPSDSEAEEQ
jgi:Uma2 family endonuclease